MSQTQVTSQPQSDMASRIFQVLQLVETQVKMPVSPEKFIDDVERLVKEYAGCEEALLFYDENPRREAEESVIEEGVSDFVNHVIERHVDTIVCKGKEYHEFDVEAVYELVEIVCPHRFYGEIILSFKPIRVQERKESKFLKPEQEDEEWTPREILGEIALEGLRIFAEALSRAEKNQSQTQEAKTQQS